MCKIAITNRKLCNNLLEQLEMLNHSDFDYVILREKDLTNQEYFSLAEKAMKICKKTLILHHFTDVAIELDCKNIHLSMTDLEKDAEKLKHFDIIGASTHSLEDAKTAEKLGATYITASHIFATDCKKGLEPRGLDFLKNICDNVNIPVFALGGINEDNSKYCYENGAKGVCMMSQAMKYR